MGHSNGREVSDIETVAVIGKRSILYFDEEQKKFSNNSLLNKRIVIDFLSTLTDNYVFQACSEFFLPRLDPQND